MEVLVVDDEPDLRGLAARALTRSGCRVDAVPNAMEALALLRKGRTYNVVVTDLNMPGITGTEFLRMIREIDLDVPVIVVTGTPERASRSVFVLGENSVFAKPFGVAELLARVAEVTGGPQPAA